MSDTSSGRLPYSPALDGLRALAVLAVMLYHGGVAVAGGGFLGVDVFFVLSGFLITTLLLLEFEANGRLDLPAFWGRRARRLLPALFLVLITVLVYGAFLRGEAASAVRADVLATLFYVSNWWFIASGNSTHGCRYRCGRWSSRSCSRWPPTYFSSVLSALVDSPGSGPVASGWCTRAPQV